MNIRKLTTIASFAAVLAAAAPAFADNGNDDSTGMSSIGVDLSRIGGSSAAVQQYLASLSPEALSGVIGGCQTAAANAGNYHADVLAFCAKVNGIGPSGGMALGFAPVDRSSPASDALAPQVGGFPQAGSNY